jgi:hypothetical protein
MEPSETTAVIFIKKKNFVLWQYRNSKGVPIQCQPNSKGNAPKTVKGAKCSFRHYVKTKKPKLKYSFADMMDGVPVIQEKLL